jgi:hypothetical protein
MNRVALHEKKKQEPAILKNPEIHVVSEYYILTVKKRASRACFPFNDTGPL